MDAGYPLTAQFILFSGNSDYLCAFLFNAFGCWYNHTWRMQSVQEFRIPKLYGNYVLFSETSATSIYNIATNAWTLINETVISMFNENAFIIAYDKDSFATNITTTNLLDGNSTSTRLPTELKSYLPDYCTQSMFASSGNLFFVTCENVVFWNGKEWKPFYLTNTCENYLAWTEWNITIIQNCQNMTHYTYGSLGGFSQSDCQNLDYQVQPNAPTQLLDSGDLFFWTPSSQTGQCILLMLNILTCSEGEVITLDCSSSFIDHSTLYVDGDYLYIGGQFEHNSFVNILKYSISQKYELLPLT